MIFSWIFSRVAGYASRTLMLSSVLVVACTRSMEEQPLTPVPDAGQQSRYADTLISFTKSGQTHRCFGANPDPACADQPVLGPPDGKRMVLGARDIVEVALLNGAILEHPTGTPMSIAPDFKIWSIVSNGGGGGGGGLCGAAVVEVSYDGSVYHVLDCLRMNDATFDLSRIHLSTVRFVRIVDMGAGGTEVDAIEAL